MEHIQGVKEHKIALVNKNNKTSSDTSGMDEKTEKAFRSFLSHIRISTPSVYKKMSGSFLDGFETDMRTLFNRLWPLSNSEEKNSDGIYPFGFFGVNYRTAKARDTSQRHVLHFFGRIVKGEDGFPTIRFNVVRSDRRESESAVLESKLTSFSPPGKQVGYVYSHKRVRMSFEKWFRHEIKTTLGWVLPNAPYEGVAGIGEDKIIYVGTDYRGNGIIKAWLLTPIQPVPLLGHAFDAVRDFGDMSFHDFVTKRTELGLPSRVFEDFSWNNPEVLKRIMRSVVRDKGFGLTD